MTLKYFTQISVCSAHKSRRFLNIHFFDKDFVTVRLVPVVLTGTGPPADRIKMGKTKISHVTGETSMFSARSSGSNG